MLNINCSTSQEKKTVLIFPSIIHTFQRPAIQVLNHAIEKHTLK